jgi:hypothetical protein
MTSVTASKLPGNMRSVFRPMSITSFTYIRPKNMIKVISSPFKASAHLFLARLILYECMSGCIPSVYVISRKAKVDVFELTSLEPAFAFAKMKAFRAVRTHMAPAAFFSVRALHT